MVLIYPNCKLPVIIFEQTGAHLNACSLCQGNSKGEYFAFTAEEGKESADNAATLPSSRATLQRHYWYYYTIAS